MRRLRTLLALCIIVALAPAIRAASQSGSYNFSPATGTSTVIGVNPVTNLVYVTLTGMSGSVSLYVLDGASLTPVQNGIIAFNAADTGPETIVVNPLTNMIYVVCHSGTVVAVDGATNTVAARVPVGNHPVAAAINQITAKLYVANYADGTVTVIDTANSNATAGPLTVGSSPVSIAVNTATNQIFVANSASNSISVIDGSNNNVLPTITNISAPLAMALNPANNTLYVAGANTGTANEFAISGNGPFTVTSSTSASSHPVDVATLNGKAYFITDNNRIEIFNQDLSSLITAISGFGVGFSITANPSTNKVYGIYNNAGDFISVIDGSSDTNTGTISGPAIFSTPFVIDTATNRAYALNTNPGAIYMFDLASNDLAQAPNGVNGVKLAVDSTRNLIYALDPQPGAPGTVRVLDGSTPNGAQLYSAGAGVDAQDIKINALTGEVYVADRLGNSVTALDTSAPPVSTTINLAGQASVMAINPTLNRIYVGVTVPGPNSVNFVAVISGATKNVLTTLPLPAGATPALIAVNPVNQKFYVVSRSATSGMLSIYNADNSSASGNVPPPLSGNPGDIAIDSATNKVFISYIDAATIDVVDGNTNTVQLTAAALTAQNNILAVDSINERLYVASLTSAHFAVLGTQDLQPKIPDPQLPGSANAACVVTNPAANRAYIGTSSSAVVEIDGATGAIANPISLTGAITALAVNPLTGRIYAGGNPIQVITSETTGMAGPPSSLTPTSFSGQISYTGAPVFTSNSNAPGVALYYQVDSLNQPWELATAGAPGTFSVALANLSSGPHTVYTFAVDSSGATIYTTGNGAFGRGSTLSVGKISSYSFVVHSGPTPTINLIPALTINEDSGSHLVTLTGITAGPLGGVPNLSVSAVSSNANIIANPLSVSINADAGTASFSFAPVTDQFGFAQVLITVTDNNPDTPAAFNTAAVVLNVTVNPVNHPPTFTVGPDITVTEAPVAQTFANFISNIVFGPPNESSQHVLQYTVSAATPDQFLVQPAISNAGALTFTPANRTDAAVPINITVQLEDDGGTANGGNDTSAPVIFHITLTPNADTLIVKNTADVAPPAAPVPDSLRDCMARARASDTIVFDADVFALDNSDAATVINTRADLPHLAHGNIAVDASDRRVTINGSAAGSCNGITIESDNNTLYNLSLINFQSSGISVGPGANNNIIGGNRNVGSGVNGQGLRLAGNGAFGISLSGPNCTGNVIKGCWIGLDAGGLEAQANLAGIILQAGAAQNIIGGSTDGEGNVISGNFFEGITVSGAGSDNNTLLGNVVGASAVSTSATTRAAGSRDITISGRSAVANGSAGIFISRGTQSTQAGGENAGEGNTIANNGGNGVEVRTSNSIKNSVRGNSIGNNKVGGITLFDGSNNGIKSPTISQVLTIGGRSGSDSLSRTTATVRVIGTSSTAGTIEIFNDSGSQGSLLLGRSSVASDLSFTADVTADPTQNITATVTDTAGNTSSFAVFTPSGTSGGTPSTTDSDGDGFPDELEIALGTDPNDPTSTPFGGKPAGTAQPLSNVALAVKLNFARTTGNDSLTFGTTLNIGAASLANQTVVVDVGGIVRSFTLDASGKSTSKNLTVSKSKNGVTKLVMRLTKATLASYLSDEGLTGDADIKTPVSKTVNLIVLFNSTFYTTNKTVLYTAKIGVSGTAR